jgi:hypothetical protein
MASFNVLLLSLSTLEIDLNEYDTHTMSLPIITALRYIFFSRLYLMFFSSLSFNMCAKYCSLDGIIVWEFVAMTKRGRTMTKKKRAMANSFSSRFFFCYTTTTTTAVCLSFHYFFPFFPLLRSL